MSSRLFATICMLAVAASSGAARAEDLREISRAALLDKVRGGWAGQMIGVSYGAPTEFRSAGKIIEGNLGGYQNWTDERLRNALDQDDLYVEMTFAEVMDAEGIDATTEQYAAMFRNSRYALWHGNAAARRLLSAGVPAGQSGDPLYNIHAYDIDFQIEADFIGLMAPGLPASANRIAERVGRVLSSGDGLYGGMFVAGMYSAAFFERDPRRVVEEGLRSIPKKSAYAAVIRDVLRWSREHPEDWTLAWRLIEEKWNRDDPEPDNAFTPHNIDAKINGAYIALGLLYGKGDFSETMEIAIRAGQDSDCNPSSAAGILGAMIGYEAIPAKWRAGIAPIATEKFSYTNYSFEAIVESTMRRIESLVVEAGGEVAPDAFRMPAQTPAPPRLEQWSMGRARVRVDFDAPDWSFSPGFSASESPDTHERFKSASRAGETATLGFSGTAIAVIGMRSGAGGRADVFLDGEPAGEIDAFIPPLTWDSDYWHVWGLKPGRHTLKVVTRADADSRSAGTEVGIKAAVVYGPD